MVNNKEYRIAVFENSQRLVESNQKVKDSLKRSIEKQGFYISGEYEVTELARKFEKTNIYTTMNSTMDAGRSWSKKGNTAVLNFASATNPGGGVVGGSSAQEECLCRVSTLFNCLNDQKCWDRFYNPNRADGNVLHNDNIIYTPKVIVFKDDKYNLLQNNEFAFVDVITCAAPNLREKPNNGWCNVGESTKSIKISDDELKKLHIKRANAILEVAAIHNIKNLVLGAFGCGAFRNKPDVVAAAYKEVMDKLNGVFENVEFAIYCENGIASENYLAFRNEFKT